MKIQEELISGRLSFEAIRAVCREYPGMRKMLQGDRMRGIDLLTLYMSTVLDLRAPGAVSIWNMASKTGDVHAVADYLESHNHSRVDIERGAEVPLSGRGLILSKSRNFQASFFHANNVFIHKWCGGAPNMTVASRVAAHEDSLYITPEAQ